VISKSEQSPDGVGTINMEGDGYVDEFDLIIPQWVHTSGHHIVGHQYIHKT
jgi:hypothetical protein